ncbi:dTMP kinase [Teredinibacter purpureus]|uniref:dTMP kinase n=1 Tax=Teredinibacter purpureus TaxID=2731756 RepID=UPI0005F87CE4|nr:dTMP kinase [Teredinibacter purpureus]
MAVGKFITVEGTEGVGKSTNIAFIQSHLEKQGIELVISREPGGTPLAEQIRGLLLAKRSEPFDATAELLMVFAARAQHLNTIILPALNAGKWVLCDRFTDATYAYQGAGRGLSLATIATLESLVQGDWQPDLTVLLDIDVETGLQRATARAALDRFESEKIEFFERVRAGYKARLNARPEKFILIDAGRPLRDVQANIAIQLSGVLASWRDKYTVKNQ